MSKTASFILGSIFGAAAGVVAGMMLAPRPGFNGLTGHGG